MADPTPVTVWSCFSHTTSSDDVDARYRDVLGVRYAYDSTVPNHKKVKAGDVLIVRDDQRVQGHGLVRDVFSVPSSKVFTLCPVCKHSGPNRRRTKVPLYRCPDCSAEFDDPLHETRPVVRYEAWYDDTWSPLPEPLPVSALHDLLAGADRQNAIRRLHTAAALALLRDHTGLDGLADLHMLTPSAPGGGPTGEPPAGGHAPALGRRRLGQQEFKALLLTRFGSACAVSGPQPREVLDAAHLYRFADTPEHHLDGGLLLRTDLHRLFDRFLLAIDTTDWTVRLHPDLHAYPDLAPLHGAPLKVDPLDRPRAQLLDDHRAEACRRWS